MSGSYKTICRVRILHNYYEKGYGNDFSIIPLPQTQKLAKQYKLYFKEVENGLDISSQMIDRNVPFRDMQDGNKLSFALILKNTSFLNYTRLPKKSEKGQIYQLENHPDFGSTITTSEWDIVESKPTAFTFNATGEANQLTLKTTGPHSKTRSTEMAKSGESFTSPFDLGIRAEGKYTFETLENEQIQESKKFYISSFLWQNRPFAILDIYSKELDYSRIKTYNIKFSAKTILWTYRLNLTKNYTDSNISIEDARSPSEVVFKRVGNSNQSNGKTLTFRPFQIENTGRYSRMRFSEKPITNFNLVIEKNGKKTEIKGLPNPPIDQLKTEMHINI